jgi:hypothetical protein
MRLRQEWIAPHFIRCGFYTAVASMTGRADYQEWIVPRSIAWCGFDTMTSRHQDPVRKPCARSPSFWHASLSGDKHRHLQRVVRPQKTMLADILFAAATIASLVRANQRNGSISFSTVMRKAIRPPALQQVRHAACSLIFPPAPPVGDLF